MMPLPFRWMLITPAQLSAEVLLKRSKALIAQAPPRTFALQLRRKESSTQELLSLGRALAALCRQTETCFLVNHRVDLALVLGADGIQLPESGMCVSDARQLLGPARLVGRSCHDEAGLTEAADAGADYATLSPVFEVPGKNPPLGLNTFATLVQRSRIPVVGLGGISAAQADAVLAHGAAAVAMIRGAYGAKAGEAHLPTLRQRPMPK